MRNLTKATSAPGIGERIFGVLVLLYASTAFFSFLKDTNEQQLGAATGSFATNFFWIVVYAGTGTLLIKYCDGLKYVWRQVPFLSVLTMFAVVSCLWSKFPLSSALHIGALLGTTVVGMYFGLRYEPEEMLGLLGYSLGIEAVASLLVSLLLPSYGIGIGQSENLWIGVFPHKISLGREMSLAFLVFALLGQASAKWRILFWSFCVLSLALIFQADAAAAKVSCVFVFSLILYHELIHKKVKSTLKRFAIASLMVCFGLMVVYLYQDQAFDFLARDENFSGRTLIWYTSWGSILDKPLFGYGYGGFWVGVDGPSADIANATGVVYGHAHNGYLNVWLNCGIVGLALFLVCMTDGIKKALAHSASGIGILVSWPFYLFTFLLLHNMTDATFLEINQSFWIIFVAVLVQLTRKGGIAHALSVASGFARVEAGYAPGKAIGLKDA